MNRRGFFLGLGASVVAAPAVVRAASLMPVRGIVMLPEYSPFKPPSPFDILYGERSISYDPPHSDQIIQEALRILDEGKVWERYRIVAINPSPRPIADESV